MIPRIHIYVDSTYITRNTVGTFVKKKYSFVQKNGARL